MRFLTALLLVAASSQAALVTYSQTHTITFRNIDTTVITTTEPLGYGLWTTKGPDLYQRSETTFHGTQFTPDLLPDGRINRVWTSLSSMKITGAITNPIFESSVIQTDCGGSPCPYFPLDFTVGAHPLLASSVWLGGADRSPVVIEWMAAGGAYSDGTILLPHMWWLWEDHKSWVTPDSHPDVIQAFIERRLPIEVYFDMELWFGEVDWYLYMRNYTTSLAYKGDTSILFNLDLNIEYEPVPEPSTMLLSIAGIGLVIGAATAKKRAFKLGDQNRASISA